MLVSPEPQLSINVISEMFLNLMLCSFMATFREKVFKCSLVTSRPRRNTNMTSTRQAQREDSAPSLTLSLDKPVKAREQGCFEWGLQVCAWLGLRV